MTNFNAPTHIPTSQTSLSEPEIIDTSALRGLIPGLFAQLMAMLSNGQRPRGAISRLWHIRRQLRALYRAEKHNFRLWLTRALKADPEWQAQVREDLGGEAALARWEKRAAKPETPTPPHRHNRAATQKAASRRPRKRAGLKTDQSGLFRLAPISRPAPRPRPVSSPAAVCTLRGVASVFLWPAPIPLTPQDLRAPTDADNRQTPTRSQTLGIWQRRRAELLEWNFCLILADLAATAPAAPSPP